MQNKTNKYKQQNGKKDKGKGNTINYYVHKHLLSGLRWLFLNNFPDFFQSHTFLLQNVKLSMILRILFVF